MNSHWFAFAMLVAALAIGYSVFVGRESALPDPSAQVVMQGFYLRDAIVTETDATGAPRARFAASEVIENKASDSVTMTSVRGDYVWSDKPEGSAASHATGARRHWVLNANRAILTEGNQLALRGDVQAHNVPSSGERTVTLLAPTLDIDIDNEKARTSDLVAVQLAGQAAEARGLEADLRRQSYRLKSHGVLRLAAVAAVEPTPPQQKSPPLSLPEHFKYDSAVYENDILILSNVRSTSEPFIRADTARVAGADLSNNKIVLRGAVQLELPKRGRIDADVATISLRAGRTERVELTGAPVKFQHRRASATEREQLINGSAARIEYELPSQMLRLSGDALFNNGSFEIVFDTIDYNLATESARGTNSRGRNLQRSNETSAPPAQPQ